MAKKSDRIPTKLHVRLKKPLDELIKRLANLGARSLDEQISSDVTKEIGAKSLDEQISSDATKESEKEPPDPPPS